jgi:hypothetical protein
MHRFDRSIRAHFGKQLMWLAPLLLAYGSGCNLDTDECQYEESLACAESLSVLHSASSGDTISIRIAGLIGWCSSLARVEVEVREDTVAMWPIESSVNCPDAPCPPGMKVFADTVWVAVERSGLLWIIATGSYGTLVDSTYVNSERGLAP